jgi:hypothetical protein
MAGWRVRVRLRSENRRGPTAILRLRVNEPLNLTHGLTIRDDANPDSAYLIAELLVEAETRDEAISEAWKEITEVASIAGFAAGIGLVPERGGILATPAPSAGTPAHAEAQVDLSAAVSEMIVTNPFPPEVPELYARLLALSPSEGELAGAVLELLNSGDQEYSARARFLTYMTILESISPGANRIPEVDALVGKMIEFARTELGGESGSRRQQVLNRLLARVKNLGNESTKDRLTRLFVECGLPETDARKDAEELWDLRNPLSHGNTPRPANDIEKGASKARLYADLSIRARFFRPGVSSPTGVPT